MEKKKKRFWFDIKLDPKENPESLMQPGDGLEGNRNGKQSMLPF